MKILVALAACAALAGCATTGPANSDTAALTAIAVQGVTVTAVSRVVTRDHADAATQAARATKIVAVATALKNFGDGSLASLPAVTEALKPLLDRANLSPIERAQADLLVQALVAVALERTDAEKYVATVRVLLDNVLLAASYYIPADTA